MGIAAAARRLSHSWRTRARAPGRMMARLAQFAASRRSTGPAKRLIDRLAGPLDDMLTVLFRDAPTGMVVVDRAGRIVRANAALARMAGQWTDLSPGAAALAILREADREAVWEALLPILEGRGPPMDLAATLDGSHEDPGRDVAISVVPLREADRSLSGAILRVMDTTAQKRLEMQLSHSQKLQAVGQLAGGIAHDFNNLLTAVIGAADLVAERPGVDGDTLDDVRQILASAGRGADLVRQLLAFGRQQTLQPRPVAINEAIRELSGLLLRVLGGKVRLELELETPGRMVRVDPTQLDQVLMNLAVNARDAMPDGGTLTLRSGHITLFRPLVRGEETIPPGRYVMIEVQDTGVGIPPDVLPRIFEPFFTTRRDRGGSGLGLSTVHGIVRQSDGYLAAESEPGRGTSLRIYLPRFDGAETVRIPRMPGVDPSHAPAVGTSPPPPGGDASPAPAVGDTESQVVAAAAPATATAAPGGRVVVLVEDEDAVRKLAARALTQRGWRVLAADCAESALLLLDHSRRADPRFALTLMVSDLVMPGMDGTALVRQVRGLWPGLPAVLVSGYAEETLRRELVGEPMVFLPKPYTMKSLAETVARVAGPPVLPVREAGGLADPGVPTKPIMIVQASP